MNDNTELAPANTSRNNAAHQDTNVHSHNLFLVDWKFATSGELLKLRINLAVQQIGAKWAKPTAIPMCKLRKGKGLPEKSNSKGSTPKKPKQTNQTNTSPPPHKHMKDSPAAFVNIQFQTMSSF